MKDFYNRKIIETIDGSHTLKLDNANEHYHSTNGAINESNHIFINSAFAYKCNVAKAINILEVGFGTGLNAYLTIKKNLEENKKVSYIAYEPYPLSKEEYSLLNYAIIEKFSDCNKKFLLLHEIPFGEEVEIESGFKFIKHKEKIQDASLPQNMFDIVYFDAFAPNIQPELWELNIFEKLYKSMKSYGVLITYSTKGDVRRSLKKCGFFVEKIPGPVGKREVTRAVKEYNNQ